VDRFGNKNLVTGKPWVYVGRVSQPTITVYSPEGSNTGAAVVVFPGGGYNVLAINLEGTEVCKKLGKSTTGKGCQYVKKRAEVDKKALQELINEAYN
jgi:hypothetical protein